jgi:hypothetical protein
MNAARVHAVLVAGVDDPRRIAQWRDEPAALERLGVAPDALDLDTLHKFAGLAVKVRHNNLRAEFALSFRLMSAAAIEIDLFAAYAMQRAASGVPYAASVPQRAADLVDFALTWLDAAQPAQALLRDVLRHEHALARLGPWHVPAPAAGAARAPRIAGTAIVEDFDCDPRDVAAIAYRPAPDFAAVERGARRLCFWRNDGGEIAIVELDAFGQYLVASLDGERSIAQLTRRLGGGRATADAVRRALAAFASIGLVELPA